MAASGDFQVVKVVHGGFQASTSLLRKVTLSLRVATSSVRVRAVQHVNLLSCLLLLPPEELKLLERWRKKKTRVTKQYIN